MENALMNLKILLPFKVYAEKRDVKSVVVETAQGEFGLLPNRLDCTASLVPGILTYEAQEEGEVYVAVNDGVMIKAGKNVFVSVRNAIGGNDLGKLHEAVKNQFMNLDEQEKNARMVMAKLEGGFIRLFEEFRRK